MCTARLFHNSEEEKTNKQMCVYLWQLMLYLHNTDQSFMEAWIPQGLDYIVETKDFNCLVNIYFHTESII